MVLSALFSALTAVCAQIFIPLPFSPVPVNLALFVPLLSARLFGLRTALLGQGLYLALGLLGLPVFAGLSGGFGVFLSPAGGFLLGYVLVAILAGQRRFLRKNDLTAMILATLSCYLCGTIYYIILTGCPLWTAISLCTLPFLPGDALKIVACLYLVKKLRPRLKNWA